MVGSVTGLGVVGVTVNMVEDAFWDDYDIAEIAFL